MYNKIFLINKFVIAAVLAAITLLFPSCKNDISVVKSLTIKEKSPIEKGEGMHLYHSQNAAVGDELFFEEMNKYTSPENYMEFPKGVKIITYNENNEKDMSLTSDYAIDYQDRKFMEAKYNVVITNFSTGEIIETEHLIWDVDKQLIYSNTQIRQTKADGSVYIGDRFEANESL
ncbi:MAG: LPS export ABC transporter periplasmic protein LptC, partial [Bacteroidales bacterium]|nr:LPS export ABC transporter periplasmic protein LptC [Bacteroidales bacterium]